MNRYRLTPVIILLLLFATSAFAQADFFKQFEDNYDLVDEDLYNYVGEEAEIKDFVYHKDLATITFKSGSIYFLRYINDRPTTAMFIGKGNFSMSVPSRVERIDLDWCTGDSTINQDFDFCFIRMADDFDKQIRDKFTLAEHKIGWKEYNQYKQMQGEYFFRPVVQHEYDNYFQLLRSAYDRSSDGYFWIDFNRYVFNYDPNRPEQVIVSYEHEGGSFTTTDCVMLQRKERNIYADTALSDVAYPTTILSRQGDIALNGLDGGHVDSAAVTMNVRINTDSTRFISAFLHYNFDVDSVYADGQPAGFHRRGDFTFMGIILPRYYHKDDSVAVKIWYHGKDYNVLLPFVSNPQTSQVGLSLTIPKDFNYLAPNQTEATPAEGRFKKINIEPEGDYRHFYVQAVSGSFDTLTETSASGIPVHYIKSKEFRKGRYECFVPDDMYQTRVMEAFDFMTGRLGPPPLTAEIFVYPDSNLTMPELVEVKQIFCFDQGTGDFRQQAGYQTSRQWFGSLMRPRSDREAWLSNAVPDYFSLMYVQAAGGPAEFYSQLLMRRNAVLIKVEKGDDLPLCVGLRCDATMRTVKGAWLMHMLRFLMFDLDKQSDLTFLKFVREFGYNCNNQTYTNADFIHLAEKYYGAPLDWFFKHWLYNRNVPEFEGKYEFVKRDDGYYVVGDIKTKGVAEDFTMPVIMNVTSVDGKSTFFREPIDAPSDHFELGPIASEPKDFKFNEFFSVLSKDNVKKK